jgi:hypothetical protein
VSESQNENREAVSMRQTASVQWVATLCATFTLAATISAIAAPNPERNVYFGEQHVHTSRSFDAFAFGDTLTGPEEFYPYAFGQPTLRPRDSSRRLPSLSTGLQTPSMPSTISEYDRILRLHLKGSGSSKPGLADANP